jgi:nitroreductase/ferredoxin
MPWEDIDAILRPEGVHIGVMRVDAKKCTRPRGSSCQLCSEDCPVRTWEMVEGQEPRMLPDSTCISCYHCMLACPRNAVSIVESYHVDSGFFATLPHQLEALPPRKPLDAEGNPAEWTAVEKTVLNRRSTRNFKDKPVPESLIRRVLEGGRFAPSGDNFQPWKFIVLTDKALMKEIDDGAETVIKALTATYRDPGKLKQFAEGVRAGAVPASMFDPRVTHALGSIDRQYRPILLGAPVIILILEDERAVSGGGLHTGICGQNMTLVANSLGLGACWLGFSLLALTIPGMKDRLGIEPPWKLVSSLAIGYPKFKQEGMVPREYRPVSWIRDGATGREED